MSNNVALVEQDTLSTSSAALSVQISDDEEEAALARPEGRKAAKIEAKKAQDSNAIKGKLLELRAELVKNNKRKLEVYLEGKEEERKAREEDAKARKKERNERIMGMDLSSIPCPKKRRYFEIMQDRILASLEAEEEKRTASSAIVAVNNVDNDTHE